ncbi:MAG: DUF6036 family nucleotidyltransferase [Isosphaeraceae bacterium]
MNSDFRDLLRLFNARKVRYLEVGGYAVMKYTEPRYTKDLDVWVEATPKNAKAVFAALRNFGAPLADLTEADFAKEGFFYQMGRPPARVDILMSLQSVRFADAWSNRVASDFDGVTGHVISRSDLIANKRAVGRPQDLVDLDSLVESERRGAEIRHESTPEKKRPKGRKRDSGTER